MVAIKKQANKKKFECMYIMYVCIFIIQLLLNFLGFRCQPFFFFDCDPDFLTQSKDMHLK